MADDDRAVEPGAKREAESAADPSTPLPDEEQATAKSPGNKKPRGKRRTGESKHKEEKPLSPEQVADALALLSTYFHEKGRTYAEVDEQLGRRPGYTGKILHGKRPYTPEVGRAIRQALGVPEDAARKDMARREAMREFRARTGSWLPSPDQRRAQHPRRPPGRTPAPEPEEPPEALFEPEVRSALDELEDALWAALGLEKPSEPPQPGRRSKGGVTRDKAGRPRRRKEKDPTEPPGT